MASPIASFPMLGERQWARGFRHLLLNSPSGGSTVRVALVHDYLTQYGGAERVLDALHEEYPVAPIFTSVLDLESLPDHYQSATITVSAMAKLPRVNTYHRGLLPLYPPVFRGFAEQLQAFDVVITDSSAWAHHARGAETAFHLCYCHSPARF